MNDKDRIEELERRCKVLEDELRRLCDVLSDEDVEAVLRLLDEGK